MTELQLAVLAVIQGITEFLPISSSGHLILVPMLTGWPDQGIFLDVAVHVGTLGAVVLFLIRELWAMLRALLRWPSEPFMAAFDRRLIVYVVLATLPVIFAGLLVSALAGDSLRSIQVIGWTMLLFGIVLYYADRIGPMNKKLEDINLKDAMIIGLFQVLALIPGTSRSGITMTASRFLGYDRTDSARFSMLLSIPAILAAGTLATMELIALDDATLTGNAMLGAALALVSALVAIVLMMRWLRRASFLPFVIYRVVLGVILLGIAWFG